MKPPRRKVLFAVQMRLHQEPPSKVWTLTLDCGHAVQRPDCRINALCETCAKDKVWSKISMKGGFKS